MAEKKQTGMIKRHVDAAKNRERGGGRGGPLYPKASTGGRSSRYGSASRTKAIMSKKKASKRSK